MIDGWIIGFAAVLYLLVLFSVALYRDKNTAQNVSSRPTLYAFSLAVYCTSWTYYGSVGEAARSGYDFLPIYIGPVIALVFGWPLILRIIKICKSQNISSIADFIAARYGKNRYLAALVTIIAVLGTVPYIALQLKAVSVSVTTLVGNGEALDGGRVGLTPGMDVSLMVALFMAAFAMAFGTRHVDTTEHQEGLMTAVAVESIVKLFALLFVGLFVVYGLYDGFGDLGQTIKMNASVDQIFSSNIDGGRWLTLGFLSLMTFVLLPRQFHMMIVENRSVDEIKRAVWLFPLYLIAINLFVVPIAMAGLVQFGQMGTDGDFYVLKLPQSAGQSFVTLIAFLGGLSAASAMVMVASVALAIMVCNDLVVPLLIYYGSRQGDYGREGVDMSGRLLKIRRISIVAVLILAYGFIKLFGDYRQLAAIGLLSFAAIVQFSPAFFGGLFWREATALGAFGGISIGFLVWAYTLLLPWFVDAGMIAQSVLATGPFGLGFLKPQALFYLQFDPLTHGVLWSVGLNLITYIGLSLWRVPQPIERLQANLFIEDEIVELPSATTKKWGTQISFDHLKMTASRYLGQERAERSFEQYVKGRNIVVEGKDAADIHALRFTEHLLASAIGAASSRLVISLLLRERNISHQAALKLLDDASEALQYNRDFLQSALDQVGQGLCVFDKNLKLVVWNRQFRGLLGLPPALGRIGVSLDEIVRFCALRGDFGAGDIEEIVADRLARFTGEVTDFKEFFDGGNKILEFRTGTMPQGGVVTVIVNISERVKANIALAELNRTLEARVKDRTSELSEANSALEEARALADDANKYKTSFLAAASHDILQPLSAARIYTACLADMLVKEANKELIPKIEKSLQSVEDILGALIELSRYDTGKMVPEIEVFALQDLFDQLALEFEPIAAQKGLTFKVVGSSVMVRSDERLMRRILQNLVSNGIKYTERGTVLLGARRWTGNLGGDNIEVQVWDTGAGIPDDKRELVFQEFERLPQAEGSQEGVGLGLSIVRRISDLLGQKVSFSSRLGSGTCFRVCVPRTNERILKRSKRARVPLISDLTDLRVLCIDDDGRVLDSMVEILERWGCRVKSAQSIDQALRHIDDGVFQPELLISDYHLGEGTGIEAAQLICKALGRELPTVIVTGDHSAETQRDIKWRGFNMLRKPIKPAALRAVIASVRPGRAAAE